MNAFENFVEDRSQLRNKFSDTLIQKFGEGYMNVGTDEMIEVVRHILSNQLTLTGCGKRKKLLEEPVKVKGESSKKSMFTRKEREIYALSRKIESSKADSSKEEANENDSNKKK